MSGLKRYGDMDFKKAINLIFQNKFEFIDEYSEKAPIPDLISKDNKIVVELGTLNSYPQVNYTDNELTQGQIGSMIKRLNQLFTKYKECDEIWWIPHPKQETTGFYFSVFRFQRCIIPKIEDLVEERELLKNEIEELKFEKYRLQNIRDETLSIVTQLNYRVEKLKLMQEEIEDKSSINGD